MAIAKMAKVIIVSHRSQTQQLLETLQDNGILEILDAERAICTKEWPELEVEAKRPKDIEAIISRLAKAIDFLSEHEKNKKGMIAALAPRTVVEQKLYTKITTGPRGEELLETVENCAKNLEAYNNKKEKATALIESLKPWLALSTPLEDVSQTEHTTTLAGIVKNKTFDHLVEKLKEHKAAIEKVSTAKRTSAYIIVCLKEKTGDIMKLLRSVDFEQANFEGLEGTASQITSEQQQNLSKIEEHLKYHTEQAQKLAEQKYALGILFDYYSNLSQREQTRSRVPVTRRTVLIEGWVRRKDYKKLEKIVSGFSAASVSKMTPAEGEEVPVEIENKKLFKPFEVVTRLYGMPQHFEIDPTALLAPFFAIFFALCLTDAGYGLIIIGLCAFLIKKLQGDKKLMWMLLGCSVVTLGAGALTGGWFGDGVQQIADSFGWTWLADARKSMMWFDPMTEPMVFFNLSLVLGYTHIMVGLTAAFVHNLARKKFIDAVCDQLVWLVMLNAIVLKLFGTQFGLTEQVTGIFGYVALVPAIMIVLFSQRQGSYAGRIAMGCYNLFSTIFYMGDVLSYLRLMALGMVTGGLAMAFNVMAKTASEKGNIIGYIIMVIILVAGHLFNTLISGLSAFVHTIRLQFVEFFPKFLEGGGRQFDPLTKEYKHTFIKTGAE